MTSNSWRTKYGDVVYREKPVLLSKLRLPHPVIGSPLFSLCKAVRNVAVLMEGSHTFSEYKKCPMHETVTLSSWISVSYTLYLWRKEYLPLILMYVCINLILALLSRETYAGKIYYFLNVQWFKNTWKCNQIMASASATNVLTNTHTHPHTRIHTHTHAHTHTHTHAHTHAYTRTHTRTHTHAYTHTHTHTHFINLFMST